MKNKGYYLNKLDSILQSEGIPTSYYSLFGYAEEAVCLEPLNHSFLVYIGQRCNKEDSREHLDIVSACLDVISRLSESNEQLDRLIENLLH